MPFKVGQLVYIDKTNSCNIPSDMTPEDLKKSYKIIQQHDMNENYFRLDVPHNHCWWWEDVQLIPVFIEKCFDCDCCNSCNKRKCKYE